MDGVSASSGEVSASPQHKALFISMLGALAYILLARIDLVVFIVAFTAGCAGPGESSRQETQC
eukprot:745800-Lingulodinium_polyedra.AAC.1